jgi:hypothetical protein
MAKTLPLSFRLPPDLKTKLVATAEANNQSTSEYLVNIIATALDMHTYVNRGVQQVDVEGVKQEIKEELEAMFLNWLEGHNNSNKTILEGIYERLEALEAKGGADISSPSNHSSGNVLNTAQYHQHLKSLGYKIGRETVTKIWGEDNEKYAYVREIAKPVEKDGKRLWEIL